jgi:hypothetical protein
MLLYIYTFCCYEYLELDIVKYSLHQNFRSHQVRCSEIQDSTVSMFARVKCFDFFPICVVQIIYYNHGYLMMLKL